jgi:2,4-dienoyl-CoA reductase-like NADH-dependent reductase (Old Yellow Enzyme family)
MPLTNPDHADGMLSDEEYHWLTQRAAGGFGLVMTCAAHVQAIGPGFPGQLGVYSDRHLAGLTRLAAGIRQHGSLAFVQLHHAGLRSPPALIGSRPVSASDDEKTGARALTVGEVEQVAADFIRAAARAEQAGFDGVELHGAHGYLICQFLSGTVNRREDRYGGSLDNRCRLLFDILRGTRAQCRPVPAGRRLSPERRPDPGRNAVDRPAPVRFGLIDLLDSALWDAFEPEEDFRAKPDGAFHGPVQLGALVGGWPDPHGASGSGGSIRRRRPRHHRPRRNPAPRFPRALPRRSVLRAG